MKRTATHPANVGAKSVQPEVRLRGKPCCLKRHFKGYLRQIVGYLDLLAARDPERFVWCSAENIQRHTRKWKSGKACGRWLIFYWLREAQGLGVLSPATRTRHGIQRRGFIVASHESLIPGVIPDKSKCVLQFKSHSDEGQITLEDSQITLEKDKITLPITLDSQSNHTPDHTADHTEKTQHIPETESDSPDSGAVLDETLDEDRRALALLALSSQPCAENPVEKNPAKTESEITVEPVKVNPPPPPLTSSTADLTDKTQTRGQGRSDKIIRNEIPIEYLTGRDIIEAVSDGLFDTDTLANYLSIDELVKSCTKAHDEMSSQPFLGRKSYADVMGRAMKILRAKYDVNVPRGWLPVMKQLRANTRSPGTERRGDSDPFKVEPSGVLTDGGSSIHAVSYQDAEKLEVERQNNPVLSALLIDTAQRLGVPSNWVAGLQYADSVIAELRRQNQPVPDSLIAIQKQLQPRAADMLGAGAAVGSGLKQEREAEEDESPFDSELFAEPAAVAAPGVP